MKKMRAWIIISLFAFISAGISNDADCIRDCSSHVVSSQGLSVSRSLDSSHQTDQSHPLPLSQSHHAGSCSHVHCSGIILAKAESSPLIDVFQEYTTGKGPYPPRVNLEVPLKPPAA